MGNYGLTCPMCNGRGGWDAPAYFIKSRVNCVWCNGTGLGTVEDIRYADEAAGRGGFPKETLNINEADPAAGGEMRSLET